MFNLRKLRRLQHVPVSLWFDLLSHKLSREAWMAYERWIEIPFKRASKISLPVPFSYLRFFHSDTMVPSFGDRFRAAYPDLAAGLVDSANTILDLRLDILGSGLKDLRSFQKAGLIPWHTDIRSGYTWPARTYHRDVKYGNTPNADVKVPWDMSRGHNFLLLGQAYRLTRDERYAQGFVAQIGDWINHNPYGCGVNWSCAMEVAIRACNWCLALELFQDSPTLIGSIKTRILGSLVGHGQFLRRHLEWNAVVSSNHYLSDLLGLAYLGLFLKRDDWTDFAGAEMLKEIQSQVDERGWDFEGSTAYHRFVLEIFFFFSLVVERCKGTLSPIFSQKMKLMADRLKDIEAGDGHFPLIGDNDSGRIHPLAPRQDSETAPWPSLLSQFSGLRPADFPSECVWLFGFNPAVKNEIVKPEPVPQVPTLVSLKGAKDSLVFSAQRNGTRGIGNHTHNDKLSFTLEVEGDRFFVDPGTAAYTGDPVLRNRFRSTAFHSTVEVDHREQNDFIDGELFTIKDQAETVIDEWVPGRLIQAHHTGYKKLPDSVVHHRTIERWDDPLRWTMTDELTGQTQHTLRWTFVLGPAITLETVSPTEFALLGKNGFLKMKIGTPRFTLSIDDILVSPAYGKSVPSKAMKINIVQVLPIHMKFEFTWKGRT